MTTFVTELRGVYLISVAHAEGLRVLAREYDFAAAAGINMVASPEDVADYIAAATKMREEGRAYVFVLTKGTEVLGVCRLIGVQGVPRLIVSIGGAYRGQGNGSFLVRHVLEFAFEELKLERVTAGGPCLRLVAQFGQLEGNGLTLPQWEAARAKAGR
jgi:RimJ/RimL family protein N-acetyltransferase